MDGCAAGRRVWRAVDVVVGRAVGTSAARWTERLGEHLSPGWAPVVHGFGHRRPPAQVCVSTELSPDVGEIVVGCERSATGSAGARGSGTHGSPSPRTRDNGASRRLSRFCLGAPGGRSPSGSMWASTGSMIAPNGRTSERVSAATTGRSGRTGGARRARRAGARASVLVAGALLDARRELLHLFEGLAPLGDLVADLLVGVHDGGVVAAAEGLPDARQRQVGELAAEVHGDL